MPARSALCAIKDPQMPRDAAKMTPILGAVLPSPPPRVQKRRVGRRAGVFGDLLEASMPGGMAMPTVFRSGVHTASCLATVQRKLGERGEGSPAHPRAGRHTELETVITADPMTPYALGPRTLCGSAGGCLSWSPTSFPGDKAPCRPYGTAGLPGPLLGISVRTLTGWRVQRQARLSLAEAPTRALRNTHLPVVIRALARRKCN